MSSMCGFGLCGQESKVGLQVAGIRLLARYVNQNIIRGVDVWMHLIVHLGRPLNSNPAILWLWPALGSKI